MVASSTRYEMLFWITSFLCFKFQIIMELGHHGKIKKERKKKILLVKRTSPRGSEREKEGGMSL